MRLPALSLCIALIAGCTQSRPPESVKPAATAEVWYQQVTAQLVKLVRQAEVELKRQHPDTASALITEGQPLINRLLAVPYPSLEAMEAASDLDHLYASMLLSNRHYGWARLLFQKNQARWQSWKPTSPDTQRRKAEAQTGIAACDKQLLK